MHPSGIYSPTVTRNVDLEHPTGKYYKYLNSGPVLRVKWLQNNLVLAYPAGLFRNFLIQTYLRRVEPPCCAVPFSPFCHTGVGGEWTFCPTFGRRSDQTGSLCLPGSATTPVCWESNSPFTGSSSRVSEAQKDAFPSCLPRTMETSQGFMMRRHTWSRTWRKMLSII